MKIKERKDKIMRNVKRNLSSIILAVIMIITSFSTVVCAEAEIGTAENPYLIGNLEELKAFVAEVEKEDKNTTCARLTSDIDLAGENWTPITDVSAVAKAFAGTFDGDYHTIKNLKIDSSKSNQGLFGLVNGGTIKNLNVIGNVSSSKSYVGGIVGKLQSGTVDSCSFSGVVTSSKSSSAYAGGIVGGTVNGSTIKNCFNNGTITGYAGGILGYGKAVIENCYNTGEIKGTNRAGGIVGQFNGSAATNKANNCYNIGELSLSAANYAYSGAISGFNGNITNCYWLTPEDGTGNNTGTLTSCELITSSDGLKDKLGTAFVADEDEINGGYPILSWQKNSAPVPKNPRIEIIGGNSIVITNNDKNPTATITASFVDADPSEITWSLEEDNGVLELNAPETITENNTTVIAKALKCGKATVVASA